MKKLLILALSVLFISCADDYTYNQNGKEITAVPYGWMNSEEKIDSVRYELCIENLVLDALFSESLVVPVVLTGIQLYEPVGLK